MYAFHSLSIPSTRISSGFDPIAALRQKHLGSIEKRLQNENPYYSKVEFSEKSLVGHYFPPVQKILNALRKGKLNGYKLYSGEAEQHLFDEADNFRETIKKHDVFCLRNKEQGVSLEFRLSSAEETARYIHILFFKRDPKRQGSFHENKRLLVKELGHFFLEVLEYDYLFGRSTWSSNSEIRRPCPKNEDWRDKRVYVGLNKNLEPIFISGIQLMYLRMGFLPMSVFLEGAVDELVVLPSSKMKAKLRDVVTDNQWDEINKYQTSQNKRWKEIVRSREAEIGVEELQKRKNRSLKIISNKDCW